MEFKVGDIVYDEKYGIGTIVKIKDYHNEYPILVLFHKLDTKDIYTLDGKRWEDFPTSLFHVSEQDLLYITWLYNFFLL